MWPHNGHVLIVDDDERLRSKLSEALNQRGFRVSSVSSPIEALARLQREECDVLLTELSFPGINALQFCERVAANHPDLPIVVAAAAPTLDHTVGAIRAGVFDFLIKPLSVNTLAMALDRASRRRAIVRELRRHAGRGWRSTRRPRSSVKAERSDRSSASWSAPR